MIDTSIIEALKKVLTEKQSALNAALASSADPVFSDVSEGQVDEDAEEDEAEEATNRIPVKATLERDFAAVSAALERIAANTYGVCTNCGVPIDLERLRAFPEAERCLACAK